MHAILHAMHFFAILSEESETTEREKVMPRKPQVRYFKSRSAYYTQWQGRQVKLASGKDDAPNGETYLAALRSFQTLMAHGTLDTALDNNTVKTIFNAYLAAKENKVRANTWKIKLAMLPLFVAKCGEIKVNQVKPYHAQIILDEHKSWSEGTKFIFLKEVKAVFNWAVKQELISRNPLKSIEMPSTKSKSREHIITPDEHDKVLALLAMKRQQRLRDIIVALENTGARPNELTEAKVGDFNHKIGALEYYADNLRQQGEHGHKTSRKGNHRVIYFTNEALEMVKKLCKNKTSNDYIFTNNQGRKYSTNVLGRLLYGLASRLDLNGYCPYSYRHTFATNWLKRGKSIELLATLLGNSADIIRKNYSHLEPLTK